MITLKPFKALRPTPGLEQKVAVPPYDVLNREEASILGQDNPMSFVHVTLGEINLDPTIDPHTQEVYDFEKDMLKKFEENGTLMEEKKPAFYIYRQIMNGRAQNGIVGCASIDDYEDGLIKRHEFTRVDKELDRINHFYTCEANTEPVFLFYKENTALKIFIENWTSAEKPIYNFTTPDGVTQMLWVVDKEDALKTIETIFSGIDSIYIADGHHRTASAYKVGLKKREENPDFTGDEEFNFFMTVIFSGEELLIMPYNRMVKDLGGLTEEDFLSKVEEKFDVTVMETIVEPTEKQTFTMVLGDKAFKLVPKKGSFNEDDAVERLDVAILQGNLLNPILDIDDPRTNKRIEFVGGENMVETVKTRLQKDMAVAFLLYPTQITDITDVSDDGNVMPPKSTWFEPKLKSVLFVHKF